MHNQTHRGEKEDVARVREIIQVGRFICNANVDNPCLAKLVQSGDFFLHQRTFGWNGHADAILLLKLHSNRILGRPDVCPDMISRLN